jgi:predicted double-glycine peptidase
VKRRLNLALVLAALVAAGETGAASFSDARPVRSLLEARHENVVVQEWDSSCGAAALATILRFQFGDPVSERSVALGILRRTDPDRVRNRGGFSLLDLKRYAETRGFAADGYAGLTTGQLLRLAPAIVPIRSHAGDHFVVFRGVVGGQAVLADPAFGNRSISFSQFERQWKDGLGFVVKARTRSANRLFASRRDLLRVEDDAARVAMDDALPKPLADAQLARAFAVDSGAAPFSTSDPPTGLGRSSNAAAAVPLSDAVSVAGIASAQAPSAAAPSVASPVVAAPVTSIATSPVSTAATTVTSTTTTITSTASTVSPTVSAALPPIAVTLPIPTTPITSSALPPPLGRR